jgi:hypothetical protein
MIDIDARAYMKICIFTYDETIKYMVDMTLNMIDILFDLMMCCYGNCQINFS